MRIIPRIWIHLIISLIWCKLLCIRGDLDMISFNLNFWSVKISQAVPRNLAAQKSSHGTQIAMTVGTRNKISGTVPGFWALGPKSQEQKSFGLAVPYHAHSWFKWIKIIITWILLLSSFWFYHWNFYLVLTIWWRYFLSRPLLLHKRIRIL